MFSIHLWASLEKWLVLGFGAGKSTISLKLPVPTSEGKLREGPCQEDTDLLKEVSSGLAEHEGVLSIR